MELSQKRQTLSCVMVDNYSVITGTVKEGEGGVEFLFLNDTGIPTGTTRGKESLRISI